MTLACEYHDAKVLVPEAIIPSIKGSNNPTHSAITALEWSQGHFPFLVQKLTGPSR